MIKVLIVEDEEMIRKGLVLTLDWMAMGCTVIADAQDGLQGLEMIRTLQPDLVITDIRMPGMNGLEMLAAAAEICRFESIILTSYEEFEYAKHALQLKVLDYVMKPIDEDRFCEIVRNAVIQIEKNRIVHDLIDKTRGMGELALSGALLILTAKAANSHMETCLRKIREEYASKLSLEDIAQEAGVSPSYLSRKFKSDTGFTFHEMLNRYRVQKAIELMMDGRLRVYEISYAVGFHDYKHLCTVFKKYTHMAPTDFLKTKCFIQTKE